MSCVVHASLCEGMSNSVLEALAYGVPVLLSDIPEHRELLGCTEFLFDPNDPESLARCLRRLALDPGAMELLRAVCSRAARRYSFDWDEAATRIATM